MKTLLCTVFRQALVTSAAVALFGSLLQAQEIRIKILNGRNGKPMTNECLNVWVGAMRGASLLAPANKEGVIVLHLGSDHVTADTVPGRVCTRDAFLLSPKPVPKGAESIFVTSGNNVDCQEWAKVVPGGSLSDAMNRAPSYSIKRILESGVTASNTCGKIKAEAKPGELIIFERPTTFWERLRE